MSFEADPARDLWERLPVALYRTTSQGRIVDANHECLALLGYRSREALLQTPAQALYAHPADRERWQGLCEAGGIARGFEAELRRADGTTFWARDTARVLRDETGATLCYEGLIEDCSQSRRDQAPRRHAEEPLRSLVDGAPSMLLVIVDGRVVYANRKGEEALGLDRGEASRGLDIFHRVAVAPECLPLTAEILRRRAAGEAVPPAAYALVTRDGRRVEGILTTDLIEREGRRTLVGYFTGHAAGNGAEKALRASEVRYRRLFEAAKDGILILDAESGEIVDANPFLCELLELARENVLGRRIWDLGPFQNVVASKAAFAELQTREYIRHDDLPLEAASGCPVDVEFVSNVYRANGHKVIQCNVRDIRQRKHAEEERARLVNVAADRDIATETRLERQRLQVQRMEAVGRLAGGLAHDFNNLVGVIAGYSQIVQKRLPAGDPLKEKVGQILKAADRATLLTQQLLAFSRKQVLQPRVLDLNAVVLETEKRLGRHLGEEVELVMSLDPRLGSVRADRGQLEQIIMNLAVNARDAMPQGGRLTIETSLAEVDSASAPGVAMTPGCYAVLAVRDTGVGMDGETQAHVFEPFFTTKEMGRGTGLGLSTVYGIVKQSGGYIWVDSEVRGGTTFKVYLPLIEEKALPAPAESPAGQLGGTETVLLVEDEAMLRDMLRETLEGSGYTVLVARNGTEALVTAEATAGPIQLMVTDVIMPGLTGPRVVERIAPSRPEMRVLYISGYSDESVLSNGMVGPGTAFLSKPFAPDAFLRKVREVLDAAAEPPRSP